MAAAKLMVMYPPPKDVQTFERVYLDEHVPMAVKSLPTGRRGTGLTGPRRRWRMRPRSPRAVRRSS